VRIEVLTSLFPGPPRPLEGIFAERRWVGMSERGHDVHLVQPLPRTPGPFKKAWREIGAMPKHEARGPIAIDRPRYLHVPGRARYNARAFARKAIVSIGARPRPDVVVADYAWPAAAVAPFTRERGLPLVISGRGSDVLQVAGEAGLKKELAGFLQQADAWCGVSRDLVEAMDALVGRRGGHLVPNGVELETFRPLERAACRRALGESENVRLVLACGHLISRKDPLLALEAFARGSGKEDRLVYLGRGPLEQQLRAEIAARGLGERVRIAGEVKPDLLARWYGACDVLLLTSQREGRPNVVLEALASGRPVLATAAGGTAELLCGHEQQMLSESRDPEILGRKLRALLASEHAPAELRGMVEHLSWAASCEALEGCLGEAVAAVGGRA